MIDRDLNHLDPTFCVLVDQVLDDLIAAGWTPYVAETLRSPERQAELVAQGVSWTKTGMHPRGLACDIVDGRSVGGHLVLWGDSLDSWRLDADTVGERAMAAESFFQALGIAAENRGLTWGGRWRHRDPAHLEMP